MLRSIGLALASLLVTIGLLEVGLRVARLDDEFGQPRSGMWKWTVYDPIMGRRNLPGFTLPGLLTIDSLGLRGPEVTVAKPRGTVRVACSSGAAPPLPVVMITSGTSATNSAA